MARLTKKFALGLFIDGYRLSVALLSRAGQRTVIEMLENFDLEEQLLPEDRAFLGMRMNDPRGPAERSPGKDNPFELEMALETPRPSSQEMAEVRTNIDVILKILHSMCPRESRLAFNLIDSFVLYKSIDQIKPSTSLKIKRAIWQDLFVEPPTEAKLENIGFIKNGDGHYLALVHDDPLVLATLLFEAMKLMRSKPPQVALIDSVEFSLAHALNVHTALPQDDHSAVILFAMSFTKIIFFHGGMIEEVLPTIHEGADSDHICETVFSKLLFEIDSGRIPALNHLILSGEVERPQALRFFKGKMNNMQVSCFDFSSLPLGPRAEALSNRTCPYTVAIALAEKALDDKFKTPFRHNFLPRRIRDRQSVYRMAWHSIVMLCILFIGVLMLTFNLISGQQDITRTRRAGIKLDQQLHQLALVAHEVDSLRVEIAKLEEGTALIDSLNRHTTRWGPIVQKLSRAHDLAGPFSVVHLLTTDGGIMLAEAELSSRSQVARLERMMQPSRVVNVNNNPDSKGPQLVVKLECLAKKGEGQE